MATVTYFEGFNNLNRWPGRLLEGTDTTTLRNKTASSAVVQHGSGHDFEDFTITLAGSSFEYDGNAIIGGVLTGLSIRNADGDLILRVTQIGSSSIASDVASLAMSILGFDDGGGFINRDGKYAWSQLLAGADTITGTAGRDRKLVGLDSGNDTYNMGDGDDYMEGGIGNDRYNGGSGFDTLSYANTTWNEGIAAVRGIDVNMVTLKVKDPFRGTDTLVSIEEVHGSRFADVFLGSSGEDQFAGLAGADRLNGGGGDNDKAVYYEDVWNGGQRGIVANLTKGIIVDGFGRRDQVSNIEWVIGTRFDDTFVGSENRDVFIGDGGVDSYDGKGNPADSGESDRVQFNWTFSDQDQGGINVDLALASGQIIDDGYGNTEDCINIEGIIGSNQNDVIKGDGNNNLFAGADGQDTMTGRGGANEYVWWNIAHFGDGDVITDFNAALDKLSFDKANFAGMDAVRIENDLNPDSNLGTFLFDNATDTLFWDANGSGAGQRFAIVQMNGVASLSAANFELY